MANAKEIKERMASIEETRKITNAMYLISSSKMKQAKKKLADTEPFFYAMQAEIARILRHVPDMHSQFFDGRESIPAEERKIGYIVVTADKGLAGAYNHNVIKATEELLKKPGKHKLFVLGEAGRQYFAKREGIEMDTQFRYTVQNPTLHRSRIISSEMVEQFRNGDLDEIHIVYTRMINDSRDGGTEASSYEEDNLPSGRYAGSCRNRTVSGRYGVLAIYTQCDGEHCSELHQRYRIWMPGRGLLQ